MELKFAFRWVAWWAIQTSAPDLHRVFSSVLLRRAALMLYFKVLCTHSSSSWYVWKLTQVKWWILITKLQPKKFLMPWIHFLKLNIDHLVCCCCCFYQLFQLFDYIIPDSQPHCPNWKNPQWPWACLALCLKPTVKVFVTSQRADFPD